jgi:hypothetical protein
MARRDRSSSWASLWFGAGEADFEALDFSGQCLPPWGCSPISRSPSSPTAATTSPDLPRHLNPQAEHLPDWFHLTMPITVLTQLARGLRCPPEISANTTQELQRVKRFLWHGNVFRARHTVDDLTTDLTDTGVESGKLAKVVREFGGYLAANACAIPNYGEQRLAGEAISTSFVESAVNQVISKRWSSNSRCDGAPAARTYYCRSAPASSTTRSPTTTDAGTPASPTPTGRTRPE